MDEKDTPLHTALKNDELEKAQAFIQQGQYIHDHGEGGCAPLHIAAAREQTEIITALIDKGVNIEARDERGFTPLLFAVMMEKVEAVEVLFKWDAKVNATNKDGETSLHFAAHTGNVDMAEILFSKNPDPDVKSNNGQTPLHVASYYGLPKMVEYLIVEKGAFVNAEAHLDKLLIWRRIAVSLGLLAILLWWADFSALKFLVIILSLAIIAIWLKRPASLFAMAEALKESRESAKASSLSSGSPKILPDGKMSFQAEKKFSILTPLDVAHRGMKDAEGSVENYEKVIEILKKNGAEAGYFKFESIFKRSEKPKDGEGKNKALLFGRLRRG